MDLLSNETRMIIALVVCIVYLPFFIYGAYNLWKEPKPWRDD